jgi:hypothetical protein
MKRIASLCALLVSPAVCATIWGGPPGWSASNFGGECSLEIPLGYAPNTVNLKFTANTQVADRSDRIVLSVFPALAWPIKIRLGSAADANATTLHIQADSSEPPSLPSTDTQQLFEHLKAGGEVYVIYRTAVVFDTIGFSTFWPMDSIEHREMLSRKYFVEAAAKFEACIAAFG